VVIPRELLDGTWGYLTGASGAIATAVKLPGGHGISARAAELLAIWTADRLS
jgi:phospholipase/carboxylesterase